MAEVEIGLQVAFSILDYLHIRSLSVNIEPVKFPLRRASTSINSPLEDFTLARSKVTIDSSEHHPIKSRKERYTYPTGFSPVRRGSVSCESISEEDLDWTPPSVSKSEEEKRALRELLKGNVLMQQLKEDGVEIVVMAVQRVVVPEGEVVINEGDFSDGCYIIESGELICSKQSQGIICSYHSVLPT